ncbi:hypothetical protein [Flavobacterium sp. KBS0721]|nr:hypothetical protein [Flavobacterium sp. KBS0721]
MHSYFESVSGKNTYAGCDKPGDENYDDGENKLWCKIDNAVIIGF